MPAIPERKPADFADILCGSELPLMVGGQAVNLWAEVYGQALPVLGSFEPFVSKDADIYGTRVLAEQLAHRAGWELHFDPRRDSIVAAILRKQRIPDETPLTIEVLSQVNGLTEADLGINTVVESVTKYSFRIPAPPVLLKAKLYNLASLVFNERPQDLKHARMLCEIVPHYLNELHVECRAGRVPETTIIKAVEYTADLITSGYAGNAARPRGLDLARVIPASIWLSGPAALQPILERLKSHGLGP
jgi:hypothetical protein